MEGVMAWMIRGAVALVGLLFLGLGLALMVSPEAMVEAFGVQPDGLLATATMRANLGGMFVGSAAVLGLGLASGDTTWFLAVAVLMGAVAVGRLFGFALDGVDATTGPPIGVELAVAGLLLVAHAQVPKWQRGRAVRVVRASPEAVWAIVSDVTTVAQYHPSVATADLLSASATGLGATRRCNFHDGSSVREEVVDVSEGRRVRLALSEFSVPMKRLEAEISLAPAPGGHTEVTFEIAFVIKGGALGQLMGALVVKRQLDAVAAKVLSGLDHHAATGETVGQDFGAQAA
ncbi:MAG: ribosome-associated toxin RatA of RatAB toxin-antitoxin module [Myxococcota bacterium]|jgi:ribosome-associated toxin RatA of RatAB toxin-antitoxin module